MFSFFCSPPPCHPQAVSPSQVLTSIHLLLPHPWSQPLVSCNFSKNPPKTTTTRRKSVKYKQLPCACNFFLTNLIHMQLYLAASCCKHLAGLTTLTPHLKHSATPKSWENDIFYLTSDATVGRAASSLDLTFFRVFSRSCEFFFIPGA